MTKMILNSRIIDAITEKAESIYEPFYIYDNRYIKSQCEKFKNISYNNKAIHFATMANINHDFLKIVKEEGINVFVNSLSHLNAVISAGFSGEEIIFTSSAMPEKTMHAIYENDVQTNIDSINQLEKWQKLYPDKRVGIRCNIGENVAPYSTHAGFFIGKQSRLGFTINEIYSIKDKSFINGLHLYVGTDIFDIDYFINCYNELTKIARIFPDIQYLNFGGGFGVSENGEQSFNFDLFNSKFSELMTAFSEEMGYSIKAILEPGRIIGGEAGYFVCRVTDTKKRDNMSLVGLNASTTQFSRPLLYPDIANHPVAVIRKRNQIFSDSQIETTLYGCSTYSRDIFTKKAKLPEIQIDDIVVFGNAGSYCASSYSSFLGFEKPEEFFV